MGILNRLRECEWRGQCLHYNNIFVASLDETEMIGLKWKSIRTTITYNADTQCASAITNQFLGSNTPSSKCEHSVNIIKTSEVNNKWAKSNAESFIPNIFTARWDLLRITQTGIRDIAYLCEVPKPPSHKTFVHASRHAWVVDELNTKCESI